MRNKARSWHSCRMVLLTWGLCLAIIPAAAAGLHPLAVDDVLDTVNLERVAIAPDGEWLAAVVERPARIGEIYGRAAYEVDPSRTDVWLVSRRTGERRNLTNGVDNAAGFWCATWSPDGSKLAMLSTRPEGGEPHGGDNVRLYIWERATGTLRRLSDLPVMTQTRYGSPLYTMDLRGGSGSGALAATCLARQENAPFLWVDDGRLLALTLPNGRISGLLDDFGRPYDHVAATLRGLRRGNVPTMTAAGSGAERIPPDADAYSGIMTLFDAGSGATSEVASIPFHPFQGSLSLVLSPDRRQVALLAPVAALTPERGQSFPHHLDEWQVDKRLGFVDLGRAQPVRWARLPAAARYPVELFNWSPDGRAVALRARAAFVDREAQLFVVPAATGHGEAWGEGLAVGRPDAGFEAHEPAVFWADARHLLVQARQAAKERADWFLVSGKGAGINVSSRLDDSPTGFRRGADGRLIALAGGRLLALDVDAARLAPMPSAALPATAQFALFDDPDLPNRDLLLRSVAAGQNIYHRIRPGGSVPPQRYTIPRGAELLDIAGADPVWREPTRRGLFVREGEASAPRDLLRLNSHLAEVDWGRTMLVDYRSADGRGLKAGVILPPDYRPGRRYPMITWVYGGNMVRGLDNYFLDPFMPGLYNLYLYAARGYVVLLPSMPRESEREKNENYANVGDGVLPAIDRLVALGIADADRIGVMGQSNGAYNVYALVTSTVRFKAAIALAGSVDLQQAHGAFDPSARGYPGIEHQKSANWSIYEKGYGLGVPPYEDHMLYLRNSPLSFVGRVRTPLLLIHGEFDKRSGMGQAESFFNELYRQGKTARLLRYWGESHSLAQSPANVRSIVEESVAWFDRYLRSRATQAER